MTTDEGSQGTGAASTTPESSTPSLRDSLEANFDAAMKAAEPADRGSDKPDVSEAARTLRQARQSSSEPGTTKDTPTDPNAQAVPAAKPGETAQAEPVDAPQHWPTADRELFAKQAPEVKNWLLGRHKAMEADYTKRTQEVAHIRREADEIREIFRPFSQAMAAEGMTVPMAVRQLTAAHQQLIADPVQGIQWLAGKYGIDLKQVVEGGAQQGQPDPIVKQLQTQVAQLQASLQGQLSAQQQEQQNANLSKVEQFATEKDAQGQLLRPHFDDVAKDVAILLRAAREAGESLDLQSAYDRAIYANPQVRTKVLAAQEAERSRKEEADRKAKADAARKAGFDVKGEGSAGAVAPASESLRAALERNFDAAVGRV